MSDYKHYEFKGTIVKYYEDDKVLMLQPGKKTQKDDFFRLKSKLDTLLQIQGTKRVGNTFTLKLDKQFNVNIDEVLKSLGMRGGIEHEDAASMVDDAAEDSVEDQESNQAPEAQMPGQQQMGATPGMPANAQPTEEDQAISPMESVARVGVYKFLFEDDMFKPGVPIEKKKRGTKKPGEYWQPLELQTGKNRNALKEEDILHLRKKFSIKPPTSERDEVLKSLDKAANYFFGRLAIEKGEDAALKFDEEYKAIDNLRPSDYGGEEELDNQFQDANIESPDGMSLIPNYDEVDYSDINIEKE